MYWPLPISIVVLVFVILSVTLYETSWVDWAILGSTVGMVGFNVYMRWMMHRYRMQFNEDATMKLETHPPTAEAIVAGATSMTDPIRDWRAYDAYLDKYGNTDAFKKLLIEGLTLLQHERYTKLPADVINEVNKYHKYYMPVKYRGTGPISTTGQPLSPYPPLDEVRAYITRQRNAGANDEDIYTILRAAHALDKLKYAVRKLKPTGHLLYYSHPQLIELALHGEIDYDDRSGDILDSSDVTLAESGYTVESVVPDMIVSALQQLGARNAIETKKKEAASAAAAAAAKAIVSEALSPPRQAPAAPVAPVAPSAPAAPVVPAPVTPVTPAGPDYMPIGSSPGAVKRRGDLEAEYAKRPIVPVR